MDEQRTESVIRTLMYRQTIRSRFGREDAKTHVASHEFTTSPVGSMQHPHRRLMRNRSASIDALMRVAQCHKEPRDVSG
jgi:hypothetical protein